MVTVGLLIRVEAKPDKAQEVEATLKSALEQIRTDTATVVWFALRLGPTTFGVFDASADEGQPSGSPGRLRRRAARGNCGPVRRVAFHRARRRDRRQAPR